jgi:NAD(P)-dependent dehydrogenase (short-subunit alcohol dehydrogenase family)
MMTSSFDKRPIFVTGAASGIGKSIVMRLLAAGFVVGLSDRDLDLCRALRDQIDPEGLATEVYGVDVRDRGAIMEALDRLETRFGPLYGAVAGAGVSLPARAEDMEELEWSTVIDINLTGAFNTAQLAGRRLLRHHRGSIVIIGSISSIGGQPGRAAYCASKAGVAGLAKVLAIEWGSRNVRVNTIAPAVIDTPLVRKGLPADFVRDVVEDRIPMGRIGRPDEVADVCAFLLGDQSTYVNGVVLPVCGGLMAGFLTHQQGKDYCSSTLLSEGAYS